MSRWQQVRRTFYDYVWEPLFVSSSDVGLVFARLIWFIWFGSLCLFTLYARAYSDPLSDSVFAQVTGVLSAVAITCTLCSRRNPWRLHWLMLTLCCVQFMLFQRPAGFTPHGRFLRSFAQLENGMTTEQVTSLMQDATVTLQYSTDVHVAVGSAVAYREWLHPGYSGGLSFYHEGPNFDGSYRVDFYNGRVVSTYCYND
jgi:hypothetical protein